MDGTGAKPAGGVAQSESHDAKIGEAMDCL